ncbi:MAG: potassium transporter KefA [Firmicutes bacterium]|nr:potassium transporter KefA [Bacillota bacterium]
MNYKLMLRVSGRTLLLLSAALLLPLLVSLYYKESPLPFVYAILVVSAIGLPLSFLVRPEKQFFAQEGFVLAGGIWLLFCLFGALPFYFSGFFENYINCFFEIASAFTTTGASVLTDVEVLPRGILFWRSFSSWMGGMGVLVFTLAFLPAMGGRTHNLLRAEATGPVASKLVPKTAQSSKILYMIYIAFTGAEVVCLRLAGMPWFDSWVHTFATVCTGGLSIKNVSIGYYNSPAIEIIITIFMILCSINFAIFFLVITRRLRDVLRSDEFWAFLIILAAATGLVFLNLTLTGSMEGQSSLDTLRHSLFQTASIMSTTGFSTVDFNLWPEFSKMVLIMLMLIGGCAGSTAGGLKVARLLLLLRCIGRDVKKIIHPRSVKVVTLEGKAVEDSTLRRVSTFFFIYVMAIFLTCLIVSLDGFSFTTTFTATLASVSNVGPGLDLVGPLSNYSAFSDLSKATLALCMIIGRLEIFPILLLLSPSSWKRS